MDSIEIIGSLALIAFFGFRLVVFIRELEARDRRSRQSYQLDLVKPPAPNPDSPP